MWPTSCQRRIIWGEKSIALAWISHTFIHLFLKKYKLNSAKKRETEVQNRILFLFPFVPSGYKRKVDRKQESFFLLLRFCGNRNIFSPSFSTYVSQDDFFGELTDHTWQKDVKDAHTHFFSEHDTSFPALKRPKNTSRI